MLRFFSFYFIKSKIKDLQTGSRRYQDWRWLWDIVLSQYLQRILFVLNVNARVIKMINQNAVPAMNCERLENEVIVKFVTALRNLSSILDKQWHNDSDNV